MNKLEEKRAERKKIILQEAKKIILKRGINDALMTDIATASGISRQRLYVYYSNIDEIIYDIMEDICTNSYLTRLAETKQESPLTVIKYSIWFFKDLSEEAHDDLLFLNLYGVYCATNSDKAKESFHPNLLLFEKQIREGQQQGLFRNDVSVEELSQAVTVYLTGYLYRCESLSDDDRNRMLDEEHLVYLADMILDYLTGAKSRY